MTTIVKPITRDHITIVLDEGHRAMWVRLANGGAEIVVLDKDATECTRLAVAPPEPDYQLRIQTKSADTVDIIYEEKQ
jgi:hypothetical protein